jgi:hypothetical protein
MVIGEGLVFKGPSSVIVWQKICTFHFPWILQNNLII